MIILAWNYICFAGRFGIKRSNMQQNNQWRKFRHKFILELVRYPLKLYCRLAYGVKFEEFKQQGNRPYLIIMNHQTAFDQFFVSMIFSRPIYYIASEDLFS